MTGRAMIFDLFGTLVDGFSVAGYEAMLTRMAGELSASAEGFFRHWLATSQERTTGRIPDTEANVEAICRALGVAAERDAVARAVQIRFDFVRKALDPRADALGVLTELRSRGCKLGLISDCSSEVPILWPETPFAPLIDVALFSASVGMRKPDSRIYRLALERLTVRPEASVYIGDGSSNELSGAERVGMHPIRIRVPYEDTDDTHHIVAGRTADHPVEGNATDGGPQGTRPRVLRLGVRGPRRLMFGDDGNMKDEEVGRYWEGNAEAWTKLSRAGYDVYRDYLNTPAFLEMLPDVAGLRGLDIGCGEGHDTRQVAGRGASVTGLDIAPTFHRGRA
jgi:putative hydrolase of the HAD superfamily